MDRKKIALKEHYGIRPKTNGAGAGNFSCSNRIRTTFEPRNAYATRA
jgi:hypothetical protein